MSDAVVLEREPAADGDEVGQVALLGHRGRDRAGAPLRAGEECLLVAARARRRAVHQHLLALDEAREHRHPFRLRPVDGEIHLGSRAAALPGRAGVLGQLHVAALEDLLSVRPLAGVDVDERLVVDAHHRAAGHRQLRQREALDGDGGEHFRL